MDSQDQLFALRHLAILLAGADPARLTDLLSRFEFLCRRLAGSGLTELVADYDRLPADSPLRAVQSALRLSAPALGREPRELAGQLVGRLSTASPEVVRLLGEAESHAGPSLVPRAPSLIAATGGLRQALRVGGGAFAITSEGRWVISAGNRKFWVWDLTGVEPLRSFAGPRSGVTDLALTPDQRWLITADSKGGLAVYLWETGQRSHRWRGHKEGATAVAALEGSRFLSGGKDGLIKLWSLAGGRALRTLRGHEGEIVDLVVTPDGTRLASGSLDGTIQLWDLSRESPMQSLSGCPERIHQVLISPDGKFLVAAGVKPEVVIWDWESGKLVRNLSLSIGGVAPRLAISPDSRSMAASSDSEIQLFDLSEATDSRVVVRSRVGSIAFLPTGDRLVSSGLREWDLTRPLAPNARDAGPGSSSLAITADSRYAVFGSADGTIAVWDLLSRHEEQRFAASSVSLGALALMPDGREAFVGDRQGEIYRFDLWTGERLPSPRALEPGNAVEALALTSDGRYLVAGSIWGDVLAWDIEEERLVAEHRFGPSYLITLALIPGTSRAIVCCHDEDDQSPWVLDWQEGRRLRRIGGRQDATLAVAVSADGRRAATGGLSGSLKVWSLKGRSPKYFPGHNGGVNSVAFLPGGRQVVAVAADGIVRVWEVTSQKCLASFTGDSGFRRCAVSPDGRTIVVSGDRDELHFLRWRR